jgi:hypothetical protein
MKDLLRHTWHDNTFGLLYGTTAKTACGKRRPSLAVVKPMETDCPACQDAVIAGMLDAHEAWQSALALIMTPEYWHLGLRNIHTGQRVKGQSELYEDSRLCHFTSWVA